MRRAAALWLTLFAVYAATIGLDAVGSSEYAGLEPHHLIAAESIVRDGDVDVRDEYAQRAYADYYPFELEPRGRLTAGRLNEPHGIGLPLLIAPAWAVGGPRAAEALLAALAALAIALAYRLALRVVPDPWAAAAALACGLSAPVVANATAIYPELAAGAALAGAALLAARLDERVGRRASTACFLLLGALPWLDPRFVPAGVVIGAFAVRSLLRARRRTLAVGSVEVALFVTALCVAISQGVHGGPTPYSALPAGAGGPTGAEFPADHLERSYRLVALFADRDFGLLRWAPVFLLAFVGGWLLLRSRAAGLWRALPDLDAQERVALMCAGAVGAQVLMAAFVAPTMFGFWFPSRHLVAVLPLTVPLVAIGLRRLPRIGAGLAALSVAATAWLWLDVLVGGGGLVEPRPDAPLGPLTSLLPRFGEDAWPYVLAGAVGAAAAGLTLMAVRGVSTARVHR